MSKRLLTAKKIAAYVGMPLLFSLIIAGLAASLYFGLLHDRLADGLSVFFAATGAEDPDAPSLYDGPVMGIGETVDGADVTIPNFGTQYAEIVCERIGLRCPLYYGDSDAVLKKGAGQSLYSLMPGFGQPTLASGHNNREFNLLKHIEVGDVVQVHTNYGTYEYEVSLTEVINNTEFDESVLLEERERLILYTCYPFDTLGLTRQRFFVYAEKLSGPTVVFD